MSPITCLPPRDATRSGRTTAPLLPAGNPTLRLAPGCGVTRAPAIWEDFAAPQVKPGDRLRMAAVAPRRARRASAPRQNPMHQCQCIAARGRGRPLTQPSPPSGAREVQGKPHAPERLRRQRQRGAGSGTHCVFAIAGRSPCTRTAGCVGRRAARCVGKSPCTCTGCQLGPRGVVADTDRSAAGRSRHSGRKAWMAGRSLSSGRPAAGPGGRP